MPATLAAALLALQLAGSPHAPPPPPPQGAWDDDAGDLARIGRLAARYDLAVIRRDAALLAQVERRVREELSAELEEARRERRRGVDRRTGALERAGRTFAELRERTDGRSLDRKRAALAEVSQAAWTELVAVAGGHERWRVEREPRPEDGWDDRADDHRSRDEREGWRPPAPPPPQALRPDQFDALARAMRQEAFAEGKLRVLATALAANDGFLSVEQVGRLLSQLAFTKEKLALVRQVRPRIVDPGEGYRLYEAFTFDDDKEELRRILGP
jgi:hypothetical protein